MNYKLYIIFFAIIGLGIAGVSFISAGYYPVAIVNGNVITASIFTDSYNSAAAYYKNFLKNYNAASSTILAEIGASSSTIKILTQSQIQKSVLAGLIENILIDKEARSEIGGNLDKLVNEKVAQATNIPDMENAVKTMYGLNLDDFKNKVLVPQAERDILTGSLYLKGQNIDDWLASKKKSSSVIIFSGRFYWNGEDVASK